MDDNNNNTDNVLSLEELYLRTRSEGFQDAVSGRIQAGYYFMLKSNYDNYVKPAFIARRKIFEDFERVLDSKRSDDNEEGKVDLLLTPITIGPAKTIKEFNSIHRMGERDKSMTRNQSVGRFKTNNTS